MVAVEFEVPTMWHGWQHGCWCRDRASPSRARARIGGGVKCAAAVVLVVLALGLASCSTGGNDDNPLSLSERSSTTRPSTTTTQPTTTSPATTTTVAELPQIALDKAPEMVEYLNTVAVEAEELVATCEADTESFRCRLAINTGAPLTAQRAEIAGGLLTNIEEVAPGAGPPVSSTRDYLDLVAEQAAALEACAEPVMCPTEAFELMLTMATADEEAALWAAL